jgi:hypothetical protein
MEQPTVDHEPPKLDNPEFNTLHLRIEIQENLGAATSHTHVVSGRVTEDALDRLEIVSIERG